MTLAEANAVQLGNQVRLSVEFRGETGELEDPTMVSFQIQMPNGNIETVTPYHDGTGKYHYIQLANMPGHWQYRFSGKGSLVAAAESDFWVANSDLI